MGNEVEKDRPPTPKEVEALESVESALVALNEASKSLGVRTKREAKGMNPFADLCGSPALDAVVLGKPVLNRGDLDAVLAKVRAAKTDRERLHEVVALLAKIGLTAAKAAG